MFIVNQALTKKPKGRTLRMLKLMLQDAEAALEEQTYLREAEREYAPIRELVMREATKSLGCNEFRDFKADFPDYDPANIDQICASISVSIGSQDLDLLPQPFDWVDIPAGQVTLTDVDGYIKEVTTFDVPAFQIAKYPITYGQYELFVNGDGYQNQNYWSQAGWDWKGDKTMPEKYWQDNKWHIADHPVVGVTWYEAYAFTQWLSAQIGDKITLLTDQQWQRAAQGDDGREYPWGNGFDKSRCNTSESGIGKTTPVNQYPNGASPFGVMDMSGNVWEWCLTDFETGSTEVGNTNTRVLRGGSWHFDSDSARVSIRYDYNPSNRNNNSGFRVVRASPI